METPRYPPLSEYGIVGDQQSCCLASRYGSIDWCCFPHVESPSVFAAILDADRGGRFQLEPEYPYQSAQSYLDRTNVLKTEFYGLTGQATLTDWMPFPETEADDDSGCVVYRKLHNRVGDVTFDVQFAPRFDYARVVPEIETAEDGVVARSEEDALHLTAPVTFDVDDANGTAWATLSLDRGETAWFALRWNHTGPHDPAAFQQHLEVTVSAWREWLQQGGRQSEIIDEGRWVDLVDRSALTLKLLTHRSSDAIAAAPTTSLPETIGGTRNWDYRYNWIRDAALTVQALSKLGHVTEAKDYFAWLLTKVYEEPASIRPLYGLHGSEDVEEYVLDHLEGYRESAPVRVGNAAKHQLQLDVYGELVLALHETSRFGVPLTRSNWRAMTDVVDHVQTVWDRPDAGIWEVRSDPQQFVHSKVMCWVALDRAINVADQCAFEGPVDEWRETRETIRDAILERGYSEEAGSFVRAFDEHDEFDATALLVPFFGFLPFDDERVQGTIETIREELMTSKGLVYRYTGRDGLPGAEGTFVLCSFWLVDALALSGELDAAEALLERILSHVSPVGLLSEEIASETGALLGNHPQAFSHIGLINSVLYLDYARSDRQPGPAPLGTEGDHEGLQIADET